ncbi:MAG: DsbA family protein [Labedaea sp.]
MVLLAGAVIGGLLYSNAKKNKTAGKDIAGSSASSISAVPDYPVRRDGVVVVAGKDDAKVTVDLYEDFLCPVCRAFEQANEPAMLAKVKDGSIRLRYHPVTILNNRSDPPGYSLDAANAALCVADGGRFPAFHDTLYAQQPEEGARGYDKGQLAKLGTDLGVTTADFTSCVDTGRYNGDIQGATEQIVKTPHLLQDDGQGHQVFGTPTIAVDQKMIYTRNPKWLEEVLAAG